MMTIGIVIPTLNEAVSLPHTLRQTVELGLDRIIVVDGGSTDQTLEVVAAFQADQALTKAFQGSEAGERSEPPPSQPSVLSPQQSLDPQPSALPTQDSSPSQSSALSPQHFFRPPIILLDCAPGRARQMNLGASASQEDVLVFLHADSQLPDDARSVIAGAMVDRDCAGGRFDVEFEPDTGWSWIISRLINLRSRWSGIATGDQAIFVRRSVFDRMGGFADIPLMEDVDFTRRLRGMGRTAAPHSKVRTSFRRWEACGPVKTILLMWSLRFLYWIGVSPQRLAKHYRPVR